MTVVENSSRSYTQAILIKLLGSRVNIHPQALLMLAQQHYSQDHLEQVIKEFSFQTNFQSYISEDMLTHFFQGESENPVHEKENSAIRSNSNNITPASDAEIEEDLDFLEEPAAGEMLDDIFDGLMESDPASSKQTILAPHPKVDIHKLPPSPHDEILEVETEASTLQQINGLQELEDDPIKFYAENPVPLQSPSEKTLAPGSLNTSILSDSEPQSLIEDPQVVALREKRKKDWETLQLRSSTSTFRPIASEYDAEVKILTDPTNKIHTEGKLEEFIQVQRDKFDKISKILRNRPESDSLLSISMINRLENSTEIRFIGMVIDKRQTGSRNYLIEFEDLTGTCMTLVQQKSHETYNLVQYLLPDHVVIVDGYLSINSQSNSRIILVNNLIFPDSPNTHKIQAPTEDLAICLISDTHFGSKEWMGDVWQKFVDYLNCRIGTDRQIEQASKIKYLCIAGDLVDGIGVYPNQDQRLDITDIYQQYAATADFLAQLPDHIEIIISPGDHDAVRKAIPTPAIPKDIAKELYDRKYHMVGCPSMVSLHGIKTQLFHGTSLIDMNMSIPGMTNEDPFSTMKEFVRARDLAPTYGKKTEIAPVDHNWLIMESLPDILHTGHLHKNGFGKYHGILLVNSGCFQAQTDFMASLGINPDYGKPTIVNIKDKLTPRVIDLVGS